MAGLILSSKPSQNIALGLGEKNKHNNLANLGFDESGHTGFQKELTAEQLANIEAVPGKADIEGLNDLKSDVETALDNIIAIQDLLIEGRAKKGLVDRVTNKVYNLYISNEKLMIEESEG